MAQHNRRSGAMDESTMRVGWSVDSWEDATGSYGVRVYGTTEPRAGRHDARRDVRHDARRDAEEYHSWREADAYAARAPSVSRDRAATVARPLGHDGHDDGHALVERRGAGQVMSDARDTLIIMPSMRPQAISPLAPPSQPGQCAGHGCPDSPDLAGAVLCALVQPANRRAVWVATCSVSLGGGQRLGIRARRAGVPVDGWQGSEPGAADDANAAG